jgi:hypothetical protein
VQDGQLTRELWIAGRQANAYFAKYLNLKIVDFEDNSTVLIVETK